MQSKLTINPSYDLCPDSHIFLYHFDEVKSAHILALGDNDEQTAQTLWENGYFNIRGIDLRPHCRQPVEYPRFQADFCQPSDPLRIGAHRLVEYLASPLILQHHQLVDGPQPRPEAG